MSALEFVGVEVGMRADDVIHLLRPRGMQAIRSGWTDRNEHGLIGKWLFDDGTVLTLARDTFPGPYTVQNIEIGKYTMDEIVKLTLNTMLPSDKLPQEEYSEEIKQELGEISVAKKRKRRKADHE